MNVLCNMKKFTSTVITLCLLNILSVAAQPNEKAEVARPVEDRTIEVNEKYLKALKGNFTMDIGIENSRFNFQYGTTKLRYFISNHFAARFGVNVGSNSSTTEVSENPDGTGAKGSLEYKYSSFNILTGIEYHFKGTKRLSPYVGFVMGYANTTSSTKGSEVSISSPNNYLKGSTFEAINTSAYRSGGPIYPIGSTGISGAIIAGADYYWADGFYFGFDAGFQANSNTSKEGKLTTSYQNKTETFVTSKNSSNSFNMDYLGNMKLGFRF